jgi:DNA-3-methyladenine glycosylase
MKNIVAPYILNNAFFRRQNTIQIARDLLGKVLVTNIDGETTAGMIVETEAYNGAADKACHAFGRRFTKRTQVMYMEGGAAYVYLCYGLHHLFNIVTNIADTPHAVLIRAAEPIVGIDTMLQRTGKPKADFTLTKGPGNMSKAFGITKLHTGLLLNTEELFIAEPAYAQDAFSISVQPVAEKDIIITPRIGVDYAGEDALLPYRFYVKGNKYVSGRKS